MEKPILVVMAAGSEVGNAEFLTHLATQCISGILAIVDMSAYGSVPLPRLDVLPVGTPLQVELATAVEKVEVDHGVEYLGSAVSLAA